VDAQYQCVLLGTVRNTSLEELDISHNNEAVFEGLDEDNQEVAILSALMDVLKENKTLRRLNLEGNRCFRDTEDAGMVRLCEGIKANAQNGGNLEILNIMQNHFANGDPLPLETFPGLVSVVAAVRKHPTLTSLCGISSKQSVLRFGGVNCVGPIFELLADEIRHHHHLKTIDLSNCPMDFQAEQCLGRAIASSGSLKRCTIASRTAATSTGVDIDIGFSSADIMQRAKERAFDQRCSFASFVQGCAYLGSAPVRLISEYLWGTGHMAMKFLKYKKYHSINSSSEEEED
jgi:hypothetical protein